MKRVHVTYRTVESVSPSGLDGRLGVRMVIKEREFLAAQNAVGPGTQAGYSPEGSSLMRFYGGGASLLIPKSDVLEVQIEE